jgi:hypothetical protein
MMDTPAAPKASGSMASGPELEAWPLARAATAVADAVGEDVAVGLADPLGTSAVAVTGAAASVEGTSVETAGTSGACGTGTSAVAKGGSTAAA